MKRLVVFLLLLACALCAAAQTRVQQTVAIGAAAISIGKADLVLFATGAAALAAFLFVWSPLAAARRRRFGTRAELSALILALLLCSILAVNGCGGS